MKKDNRQEAVTVKLAAETNEVNAAAVGTTMNAVVALINEAAREIKNNEELLIKARPFADGSFKIPLELIVLSAGTLFAESPLINQLLITLQEYFKWKIKLRGSVPTSEADSTIVIDGNTFHIGQITLNLLSPTSITNREFIKAVDEIKQDPDINGFEVYRGTDADPIVRVSRDEFQFFSQPSERQQTGQERDITTREELTIRSIVFEGKAKWRFNYRGNVISALIRDERFLESVKAGEEFSAGDRLEVELVTHQEFEVNDYVNKSYKIMHVWGHERHSRKPSLFDK